MKRKRKGSGQTAADGDEFDRIGRLGEEFFAILCTEAKLICNKFGVDRTGKDFLVENRLDKIAIVSYDKRPQPRKYLFQVKTIYRTRKSVSISLANAERLAKDEAPAAICAFIYNKATNKIDGMEIIHVMGEPMARILRRLRLEYKKENDAIHNVNVSFSVNTKGIDPADSQTLLKCLEGLGAPTMEAYALRKREQLNTLGFDDYRYAIKMTFEAPGEQELTEGFLGLRELTINHIQAEEVRFSIPLPEPAFFQGQNRGTVLITPEPIGEGRLTIVDDDTRMDCGVDVQVVGGPPVGGTISTILFRWPTGHLLVDYNKKNMKVTVDSSAESVEKARNLIESFRFLKRIISKRSHIKYVDSHGEVDLGEIELPLSPQDKNIDRISLMLDWYDAIYKVTDSYPSQISLSKMWKTRKEARVVFEMITRNLRFQTTSEPWDIEKLEEAQGQYVTAVELAGSWYGIQVPLKVSTRLDDRSWTWYGFKQGAVYVEKLNDGDIQFNKFSERVRQIGNTKCCFIQPPDMFLKEGGTLEIRV